MLRRSPRSTPATSILPRSVRKRCCAPTPRASRSRSSIPLMSKVTIQLVVSPAAAGAGRRQASRSDREALDALKGAIVGVTAVGGTQESPRDGLRPRAASIRKPTSRSRRSAIRSRCRRRWKTSASMPSCCRRRKASCAEKAGTGTDHRLARRRLPAAHHQPYLVLAAKKPIDDKKADAYCQNRCGRCRRQAMPR